MRGCIYLMGTYSFTVWVWIWWKFDHNHCFFLYFYRCARTLCIVYRSAHVCRSTYLKFDFISCVRLALLLHTLKLFYLTPINSPIANRRDVLNFGTLLLLYINNYIFRTIASQILKVSVKSNLEINYLTFVIRGNSSWLIYIYVPSSSR